MTDQCSQIFHALADKTRQRILKLLKKKECCVSDVCSHFDMTQPSISHHLDILKRCGLVKSEKRGREVYYRFEGMVIVSCCCDMLQGLDIQIKGKK